MDYNIDRLLELEEFKPLIGSKDLAKFLSKYVSKSVIAPSSKALSVVGKHKNGQNDIELINTYENPNSYDDISVMASELSDTNQGVKIQSEITSTYLIEYMMLKACDRYEFIEKIFLRNS